MVKNLFRNLTVTEIKPRILQVNNGGVRLMLWKAPRAVNTIFDETFGPMGWSFTLSNNNHNCLLSVYDPEKKDWVTREGVGEEDFAGKALVNDALSVAASHFGCGIELYSAPEIFIPASKLKGFKKIADSEADQAPACTDKFEVLSITYDDKRVTSVTIGVRQFSNTPVYLRETFGQTRQTAQESSATPQNARKPEQKPEGAGSVAAPASAPSNVLPFSSAKVTTTPTGSANEKEKSSKGLMADDDVIVIGYLAGKKYGEVKNTQTFLNTLKWALNSKSVYTDEKKAAQLIVMKQMAESLKAEGKIS